MVKRSNNSMFLPLLLSLSTATTFTLAQFSSSNTACTSHYVVEDGDTCDIIGQKTFTSTAQIMSLNLPQAGPSCFELQTGMQLCLGTYGNDCQLVHRARNSDTCESITSQFSIDTATLLANNAMLGCDQVYGGLMLCVVGGIIRPPAPIALNVSYDPLSPGYTNENSTMPLGTAIIARNAGTLLPAPTQSASVVAASVVGATVSAATSATSLAAASASSGSAGAAAGTASADKSKSSSKGSSKTHWGEKGAEKTHAASHHGHHGKHHDAHHDVHKPHGHSHHDADDKNW